jgi:hypothetical protein
MAILLPKGAAWLPADWISNGLLHDLAPLVDETTALGEKVRFCVDAQVDTLDLRQADAAEVRDLERLLERAIEENRRSQGASFHQPEAFPRYLEELCKLKALLAE